MLPVLLVSNAELEDCNRIMYAPSRLRWIWENRENLRKNGACLDIVAKSDSMKIQRGAASSRLALGF